MPAGDPEVLQPRNGQSMQYMIFLVKLYGGRKGFPSNVGMQNGQMVKSTIFLFESPLLIHDFPEDTTGLNPQIWVAA